MEHQAEKEDMRKYSLMERAKIADCSRNRECQKQMVGEGEKRFTMQIFTMLKGPIKYPNPRGGSKELVTAGGFLACFRRARNNLAACGTRSLNYGKYIYKVVFHSKLK